MRNDFIRNLLDLKGVIVKKVRYKKNFAMQANVSINTVARLLPPLAVSAKQLPEVFCIDEFKGNTGYYKYQVSLMDGITRKPIDIIECRYKSHLFDYFNKFTLEERKKVKYVVIDLWKAYKDLAKTYFNWVEEIRNAIKVTYSNGPMEGYNNKIKTLKRVAFGFRNFTNFKARILLMSM